MATFFSTLVSREAAFRDFVKTLAEHTGRVFVGRTPQDRVEVTQAEALTRFIEAWELEEHTNVYLTPAPKGRKSTKQAEWDRACNEAEDAVQRLRMIQTRTEEWGNALGTGVSEATRSKLEEVKRVDLATVEDEIDKAKDVKLPVGYGRD